MSDLAPVGERTFTRLSQSPTDLGESPVWDAQANCLWWIDGVAGRIHRCAPQEGTTDTWHIGGHIGAIALAEDGALVLARDHAFELFWPETGELRTLHRLADADPLMRLNDAKLDRQGRLICVGMGRNADRIGALHQLTGRTHRQFGGDIAIGNGVCFSPDGETLYFSDTLARKLFACDYDPATGATSEPRLHVDTGRFDTGIDGATVDDQGRIWASFIHKGEIACLGSDGTLLSRFPAPTDLPSSLAFGGPDLRTLFVTSIRDSGTGRAVSKHADGGHLFAIGGLDATGLPEARFQLP